jgi:hypothetical protein
MFRISDTSRKASDRPVVLHAENNPTTVTVQQCRNLPCQPVGIHIVTRKFDAAVTTVSDDFEQIGLRHIPDPLARLRHGGHWDYSD